MMTTVEGVFRDGRIELRELPPSVQEARVLVTFLPAEEQPALPTANRQALAILEEWKNNPLTEEERGVLDEFQVFRETHPFSLRSLMDESCD